jgi:hypothetical protein
MEALIEKAGSRQLVDQVTCDLTPAQIAAYCSAISLIDRRAEEMGHIR